VKLASLALVCAVIGYALGAGCRAYLDDLPPEQRRDIEPSWLGPVIVYDEDGGKHELR
jgi:hypothetical protein